MRFDFFTSITPVPQKVFMVTPEKIITKLALLGSITN